MYGCWDSHERHVYVTDHSLRFGRELSAPADLEQLAAADEEPSVRFFRSDRSTDRRSPCQNRGIGAVIMITYREY